jgi:hypothetical protein
MGVFIFRSIYTCAARVGLRKKTQREREREREREIPVEIRI